MKWKLIKTAKKTHVMRKILRLAVFRNFRNWISKNRQPCDFLRKIPINFAATCRPGHKSVEEHHHFHLALVPLVTVSQIIAFDEGELLLFVYRTWSSNRSVCHAISRFGRHLGPDTFCLDLISFSRPGAGIYFVTLVRRWNVGDFLFTTGLFIVFPIVFN